MGKYIDLIVAVRKNRNDMAQEPHDVEVQELLLQFELDAVSKRIINCQTFFAARLCLLYLISLLG